jgi:chitooligosaccharide deacetylase
MARRRLDPTLARHARSRPELVRRLVAEGHEPALHGDAHWPPCLLPRAIIRREIEAAAGAVLDACGERAHHYRPPFGFITRGQARFIVRLGYRPVLGDLYPEDAARPGVATIVDRVMRRLRPGSILILHDGSPRREYDRGQTAEALDVILARAAGQGLRAVSVSELAAAGNGR